MTQNVKVLTTVVLLAVVLSFTLNAYADGVPTATTTALSLSAGSVASGTAVTLTATITPSGITRGQVLFCDASAASCAGTALLGTAQVTSAGTASVKRMLGIGSYSINAIFVGYTDVLTSTSPAQALTVTGPGNFAAYTEIAAYGSAGDYTLVGTVIAYGKTPPSGTMSFLDTSNSNAVIAAAVFDPATLNFGVDPGPGSPYSTGNFPYVVVVGDFNNDGRLDVAVANNHDNTVSVYLGNGDGTFGTANTYAVGNRPLGLAAGDFNHDGKLDLVVANNSDATVGVLIGNGDGTFQNEVTYAAGNGPYAISAGDFDRDGFLDVVVTNGSDNTVSILLGNGDGTLQTQDTDAVGTLPEGVYVEDLNGDGIADLAVVNTGDNAVGVLLGVGDGTFQSQVAYAVGNHPIGGVAAGDLNGDGKPDLVVSNASDNTVSVLLGNGDGTFQGQVAYGVGFQPIGIVITDLNHDGKLDLAVADEFDDSVGLLLGNGDGTFQAQFEYPSGDNAVWVAAGDFNGDGLIDLAVSNQGDNDFSSLLNIQSELATASGVFVPGFVGTHNVLASYPGDTIRVASQSSTTPLTAVAPFATTTTLTAAPNPSYSGRPIIMFATVSPTPTGAALGTVSFFSGATLLGTSAVPANGIAVFSSHSLAVGGDALAAVYSGNVGYLTSTSAMVSETVLTTTATTTSLSLSASAVVVGTPVTLTATVHAGANAVSTGQVLFCNASAAQCDGPALFGSAQLKSGGTASVKTKFGAGSYSITAVFNGAGGDASSASPPQALTVTGAAGYASTTTIGSSGSPGDYTLTSTVTGFGRTVPSGTISFVNTSANNVLAAVADLDPSTHGFTFLPSADSPLSGLPAAQFVATGDFNGDGVIDLAVLNGGSPGTVWVYLGVGDGTFSAPASYDVGSSPQAIALADANGDGKLDLMVCNLSDYTVSTLLGNGDGTFQTQLVTDTDYYPIFVAVGDFNHDGIPDLATADWDGTDMGIHLGNGDGTFQNEVTYSASTPFGLVIGDFNLDGVQDVATSDGGGSVVDVFLGIGDGTFQQAQVVNLPDTASAYWMAGGDFRKDGRNDLVVADQNSAVVYVLLSNGDGTFAPAVSYAVAGAAWGVSVGDINGDGIPDIVVPEYSTGMPGTSTSHVSVLLGNGDGTFAAKTDFTVGGGPTWAALADLNGDGTLDIVTSNHGSNTATILLQAQTATATATGVAVYGTGSQLVQATYPGDAERTASQSATVSLTGVPQTSTSTSLTAAPNPAFVGQTVTLTATISPHPTGISLGLVSFFDGETLLVTSPVNGSGVATLTTTGFAVGAHSLTAVYSGNAGFIASSSSALTETISSPATTATALAAAPNPAEAGQAVTLTATISPHATGSSLGTVSFYDGEALLGTGAVNSSGIATFSLSSLAAGAHSLTAAYSGNVGFSPSTSSAVTETITAISTVVTTTTTLVAAPNPASTGQPVVFTATVAPAPSGTTLGTVSFYQGSTLLGSETVNSSGVATFTISSLPVGALSITAVYSGNAGCAASTSAALIETVTSAFTVMASTVPVPATEGASVTIDVTVPPLGGSYDKVVTMSASGLPLGATGTFNPPTVTPEATGAPTVLTIQLAALTAGGRGSPGKSPGRPWPLAEFAVAATLFGAGWRKRTAVGTRSKKLLALGIVAAAFFPLFGCGGGFAAAPTTQPGSYVVTITGTSGTLKASTTVTVVVR
jgi:hypothetical protein